MRSKNMKDHVVSMLSLSHHGMYDPAVVMNPSHLQASMNHMKDEMDTTEAACQAALHANKHLLQEMHLFEKVRQEHPKPSASQYSMIGHQILHCHAMVVSVSFYKY